MSRDHLTLSDVLSIHQDQIERYGGADGVRDMAGLEAAIARPQSGYYDGLIDEAAALWESLSQNHPFIDGNKRTAYSSTFRFLALNDVLITADPEDIYPFIIQSMERGDMTFKTLVRWLSDNTQPIDWGET